MMDEVINKLVRDAKAQDWGNVDKRIPEVARNAEYVKWAYNNALTDRNGNVRDLAASIIEKATLTDDQFGLMREKLYQRMISDSNQYVRFRSAFALAAHGLKKYKMAVIRTLKQALKDKGVEELARNYLENMQ